MTALCELTAEVGGDARFPELARGWTAAPGTAVDWGVLGTAVAALAWFFDQFGLVAENVPVR